MLFYVEHTDKAGQVSRHFVEAPRVNEAVSAAFDALGEGTWLVCKRLAGMSQADRLRFGLPTDLPRADEAKGAGHV